MQRLFGRDSQKVNAQHMLNILAIFILLVCEKIREETEQKSHVWEDVGLRLQVSSTTRRSIVNTNGRTCAFSLRNQNIFTPDYHN